MPSLRVMLDQLVAPVPGGIGRYATELAGELAVTAPAGWDVVGVVSTSPRDAASRVRNRVAGLAKVETLPYTRRVASLAWNAGLLTHAVQGPMFAPGVFAPVPRARGPRPGDVRIVTIHDVVPWTHPDLLTAHGARWHRSMARRAWESADGIVVTTNTVAAALTELLGARSSVFVAPAAPSAALVPGPHGADLAKSLNLPPRYLLSVGTLEPRKGLASLIGALCLPETAGLPLLIVGQPGWGRINVAGVASKVGLAGDRVRVLGWLSDAELAVVMSKATVFVYPSLVEGFGLPVLEALSLGIPVVHSDDPALVEVGGGAGVVVERAPVSGYAERLAHGISLALDPAQRGRLAAAGLTRAADFSWKRTAMGIWGFHEAISGALRQ